MNFKILNLNGKKLLVVDAPTESTHSSIETSEGLKYQVFKKRKLLDMHVVVDGVPENVINIGKLTTGEEGIIANLFTPVKVGNFWEYEHNGVFYPKAIDVLKDIIEQQTGFTNPFVLIINQ